MLTFLADENFDGNMLRGLLRRRPAVDIVRVQDIGLSGRDDPTVLEQAARLGRVLLTHDAATVPDFAYARVSAGQSMPGVLVVQRRMAIGQAIDEVLLVAELVTVAEMNGQVQYLPL